MFPLRPLSLSSFFRPLSSVLSLPSSLALPLSPSLSRPPSLALPVSLSHPLFCLSLYHSDHPIPASSYPLPPSLIPSSCLLTPSLALPLSPSPVLFVAVSQRPSYPHLFLSPYALSRPLPSSPCLLIPTLIPFCPLPSYNKKSGLSPFGTALIFYYQSNYYFNMSFLESIR